MVKLKRFDGNPIISPRPWLKWEVNGTFNPAAVHEAGKVHIVYRAMAEDNTSQMGYASTFDGFNLTERLNEPIYAPREEFEKKLNPGGNSGCEDPRISKIGDRFYMCYTAYDGINPTRVALTSISVDDFINKRFNWEAPRLISPPDAHDKDAGIFPELIGGKYVIFHRLQNSIWMDYVDRLEFGEGSWLKGEVLLHPREGRWDNGRVGISSPPVKTESGWILMYHGITEPEHRYKAGAMLLDLENPRKIISLLENPIIEPETEYEKIGPVPSVVFPCGAVIIQDQLFVYYGGADKVIGVATIKIEELLDELLSEKPHNVNY
jgi:predicted GH43/DUF377 family glycosyl hydrolase